MQQHSTDYLINLLSVENVTAEMTKHSPNDVEPSVEDPGNTGWPVPISVDIGFTPTLQQLTGDPPPVPRFWHFAPLTLRSTASATDVREKLFQILHDLDVNVEAVSSFWKYRLQKVCGDAYLDIQCHFFKQDSEIVIDVNLLSGDRFVWRYLAQNIRVMFAGGNAKGECYKPRDYPFRTDQLFQLLEHGSMNDKRRAMRSLALYTSNVDISKIEPWLHKPTVSFLEKEIQRWAEYIKVNRAHL